MYVCKENNIHKDLQYCEGMKSRKIAGNARRSSRKGMETKRIKRNDKAQREKGYRAKSSRRMPGAQRGEGYGGRKGWKYQRRSWEDKGDGIEISIVLRQRKEYENECGFYDSFWRNKTIVQNGVWEMNLEQTVK